MVQVRQKYLGAYGLIIFIALLSAFIPLSTDLYLPALPGMSSYFNTSADRINLTLSAFFIFYALGTLVWGPLSDHYGRRPVLVVGMGLYIIASSFCALIRSVDGLILCRIFQAIGGSAAGAVAIAIVKDVYSGRKRETVMAIVQSMVTISPAVAPVIGAFLMKIISWRGIFWTLSGIGIVAVVGSLLFEESIAQRSPEMLHQSLGHLRRVVQNRDRLFISSFFAWGHLSYGFHFLFYLYLPGWFSPQCSDVQLLFLAQCFGNDCRSDDLLAVVKMFPCGENNSCLLCHNNSQRSACVHFWKPAAMDLCLVHPTGLLLQAAVTGRHQRI